MDSYDDKIKDQEDYYKKKKEEQKKANDDAILEQKAYAKANELITKNNQSEILKILQSHSKNYKEVGSLLGKNFNDAFQEEINKAKKALDDLKNANTTSNPNKNSPSNYTNSSIGGSSSSSSTNSGSSGNVDVGDNVWLDNAEENELYSDASHEGSKGTGWDNGIASGDELKVADYDNGFMRLEDSNGNDLGWVERDKLNRWNDTATYSTGGRTPSDISDSGATAILHKNEKILNEKDTNMLDDIYNWITSTGSVLMSNMGLSFNNPNNYTLAGIGTDLNGLTNGVTNNSSISQPISISFGDIINHNGAEANMNMDKIVKTVKKSIYEDGRKYR